MAGNKSGAAKARATNLAKDPNYYSKIGAQSWKDPQRSRKTGFALDPALAQEAGRKGGKKTKSEETSYASPEEILAILAEAKADGSDVSE